MIAYDLIGREQRHAPQLFRASQVQGALITPTIGNYQTKASISYLLNHSSRFIYTECIEQHEFE